MTSSKIIDFFIKDIELLKKEKSIVKNERVLTEDFVPEKIYFREEQLEVSLAAIKRFLQAKRGPNLIFYGNTGTGKTLVARYIATLLKMLNLKEKLNVRVSYVNCKSFFTKEADYYIIGKIYSDITGDRFKRGKKKYETFENLLEYINDRDLKVVIFLDEFDSLFNKKNTEDLLYALLRDFDISYNNRILLVMITNNITFINDLDPRVKSSFSSFVKVPFKPYDARELSKILYDRAMLAFEEDAIDNSLINYIAAKVAKLYLGDARVAINVLRLSALIAESKGLNKITKECIDEAFDNIDFDVLKSLVLSLNTTQKVLLLSLIENSFNKREDYISYEELYHSYVEMSSRLFLTPLSRIAAYKNMRNLEMILGNFLDVRTVSEGKKGGYKKVYKLLLDEETMKKLYDLLKNNIFNA